MPPLDLKTLSDRIAYARKALELTQAELGQLAGISQSSIALLESGSTKAPKRALELAQALQVPLEWLMQGELPEQNTSSKIFTPVPEIKYASLASRLIVRREQCGLTQAQLAAKSGLSQATIGNLETGRNKGTKRILELAQALHVTPEWLLNGGSLEQAKADALRRDFGVNSEEQEVENMLQRFASLQAPPSQALPPRTTTPPAGPATLPIIDWSDKALATPTQAHNSHLKRGFFSSPFQQSKSAFWMRVPTDVMEPEYRENDLLLIDPELTESIGDDIVILTPDGTPEFGRLRKNFNNKYLEILNTNYPSRLLKLDESYVTVGVVNGMVRRPRQRS